MRLLAAFLGVFFITFSAISLYSYAEEQHLTNLPGYVDFDQLPGAGDEPTIVINLDKSLLTLLSAFDRNDPATSEALKNLESVRVQAFETWLADDEAEAQMASVQQRLEAASWNQIVRARDRDGKADIYLKQNGEGIQGVFVVAVDDGDVVFVNVLGDINPEEIAGIVKRVNVDVDLPL